MTLEEAETRITELEDTLANRETRLAASASEVARLERMNQTVSKRNKVLQHGLAARDATVRELESSVSRWKLFAGVAGATHLLRGD